MGRVLDWLGSMEAQWLGSLPDGDGDGVKVHLSQIVEESRLLWGAVKLVGLNVEVGSLPSEPSLQTEKFNRAPEEVALKSTFLPVKQYERPLSGSEPANGRAADSPPHPRDSKLGVLE